MDPSLALGVAVLTFGAMIAIALAIRRDARRGAIDDPGTWTAIVILTVALGVAIAVRFWGIWLLAALAVAGSGPLAYGLVRVDPDHTPPGDADFTLPSTESPDVSDDADESA